MRHVSHAKITHRQFTFSGDAYLPAISPDGLFVAYVKYDPGEKGKLKRRAERRLSLHRSSSEICAGRQTGPRCSLGCFPGNNPLLMKKNARLAIRAFMSFLAWEELLAG
jgi:hypothetical protein